jgi:Ribonuclease G/E
MRRSSHRKQLAALARELKSVNDELCMLVALPVTPSAAMQERFEYLQQLREELHSRILQFSASELAAAEGSSTGQSAV